MKPLDGLDVVVKDFGLSVADVFDALMVAFEVGGKNFDDAERVDFVQRFDGLSELHAALIGKVVTSDGGDHDVLEAEVSSDVGDVHRLVGVDGEPTSNFDRAEAAGAGAGIAKNHEGGGLLAPAFGEVGASRRFANGVQVL